MIGSSMSLSVLSSQQLQAQRDAQAARTRADRLQELSRQAQDEASQATARSEDLNRQSQASRQDAVQAQQRADKTPSRQTIPAPEAADTTTDPNRPQPNGQTPSTVQRVGQDILAQVSGYTSSAAAKSATEAYQRVQAAFNLAATSPVSPAPNNATTGTTLSAVV